MKFRKSFFLSTPFLLACILLVSLFVRFYKLSDYPVGFHIDEANIGYNAYSLLLTGRDSDNQFLPLYTSVFNDDDPTGYHFLDILPIKFFGLTVFATRFVGALFGSFIPILTFFLVLALFRNRTVALLSAVLAAFTPWSVILSRSSQESLLAFFFVMMGFTLVFSSLHKRNLYVLLSGALLLIVSFFVYHTPRVFVPLSFFVFLLYYFFFIEKNWKKYINYHFLLIAAFIVVSISSGLLIYGIKGGTNRFNQVSIFTFPETRLLEEEAIREDGQMHTGILQTRMFHNKVVSYSRTFLSNYFTYFSGSYLFIDGGFPMIFTIPQMGLFFILELPFLLVGFIGLWTGKERLPKICLLWLFLAPAVAAITFDDSPNIRRSISMFTMIDIISAYGFYLTIQKYYKQRLWICIVISALLIFNISYFFHQYFVNAAIHRPWYRNNGTGAMMAAVNTAYPHVTKVIISKTIGQYPEILFYSKFDPSTYQKAGSPKDSAYKGFGKFYYVPQKCPSTSSIEQLEGLTNLLFIDSPECDVNPNKGKVIVIYREDGTKAFRLVYGSGMP